MNRETMARSMGGSGRRPTRAERRRWARARPSVELTIDVLEIEAPIAQRHAVAASVVETLQGIVEREATLLAESFEARARATDQMRVTLEAPPRILGASVAHAVWSAISEGPEA